jgi:two-component system chemotaxis sensor kinase CheA
VGIRIKLFDEYDYDIVEDFILHYSVMTYQMENLIIYLSKQEQYKDNIGELFRIVHNIKSAALFLKIKPISKLATLAEEVLEGARELNGPANDDFIDWLLSVKDQFSRYNNDIENDNDSYSELDSNIIKIPTNIEKQE